MATKTNGVINVTVPEGIQKPEAKDEKLINDVEGLKNSAKGSMSSDTNKAQDNTDAIKQKAYQEEVEKLNENQKANQAKGEGQYGMINDKDYATTLRLARQANAYNSRPRTQIMSVGTRNTGGVQSLGYGYDKPELNTYEQQAMNQAIGLDTNQKQLAQQLQAAVNSKNLDAFKQAISQAFGITLDDFHAKMAMDQFAGQLEMQDITSKYLMQYKDLWERYFGADTAATLYNTIAENPTYGQQLSLILTGKAGPDVTDMFAADFMSDYMSKHATGKDDLQAWNNGTHELDKIGIKFNVRSKAIEQIGNNFFTNFGAFIQEWEDRTQKQEK